MPCVRPSFGKLEFQIPDLEHFLRNYEIFEKLNLYAKRCPNFQLFPNLFVASVRALWSNTYFVGDIIALAIYLLTVRTTSLVIGMILTVGKNKESSNLNDINCGK